MKSYRFSKSFLFLFIFMPNCVNKVIGSASFSLRQKGWKELTVHFYWPHLNVWVRRLFQENRNGTQKRRSHCPDSIPVFFFLLRLTKSWPTYDDDVVQYAVERKKEKENAHSTLAGRRKSIINGCDSSLTFFFPLPRRSRCCSLCVRVGDASHAIYQRDP